jgi:MoaE-MoaD fusion protein
MHIRVCFFGVLKEIVGQESEALDLPEPATLADLLSLYEKRIPRLQEFLPSVAMSVNQEYARPEMKLNPGDEVGFLPPVSGGHGGAPEGYPHASIVHGKIETERIVAAMKHPEDGAVVLFEGVVRNHSRGRRTLVLEYEAYLGMALKQMEALAEQALRQFQVREVALVHRLGRLNIGEASVLIVVASAHRAAAFEACRWLIDTLKRTVPIWKKEYFEDGAVWADGEPFPEEIRRAEGSHSAERASK